MHRLIAVALLALAGCGRGGAAGQPTVADPASGRLMPGDRAIVAHPTSQDVGFTPEGHAVATRPPNSVVRVGSTVRVVKDDAPADMQPETVIEGEGVELYQKPTGRTVDMREVDVLVVDGPQAGKSGRILRSLLRPLGK
jgi:hypothetical protein